MSKRLTFGGYEFPDEASPEGWSLARFIHASAPHILDMASHLQQTKTKSPLGETYEEYLFGLSQRNGGEPPRMQHPPLRGPGANYAQPPPPQRAQPQPPQTPPSTAPADAGGAEETFSYDVQERAQRRINEIAANPGMTIAMKVQMSKVHWKRAGLEGEPSASFFNEGKKKGGVVPDATPPVEAGDTKQTTTTPPAGTKAPPVKKESQPPPLSNNGTRTTRRTTRVEADPGPSLDDADIDPTQIMADLGVE
jgi:hypothetical protein